MYVDFYGQITGRERRTHDSFVAILTARITAYSHNITSFEQKPAFKAVVKKVEYSCRTPNNSMPQNNLAVCTPTC